MENYMKTMTEVLTKLKAEGYTVDFNLKENCLECQGNYLQIHPEEFVVDKHYRFEGDSDPGDEAVVYAISSVKHDLKGTLVNAYGMYGDQNTQEMIKALKDKTVASTQSSASDDQVKSNQATPQRPEGDRPLDAQLVSMNLNEASAQIRNEQVWTTNDRNALTLYKSGEMRIVLIGLHEGAEMKKHTAPGRISVQVLEGKIAFNTDEETVELEAGQMIALHAGIPHSVNALKESIFLLTLSGNTIK